MPLLAWGGGFPVQCNLINGIACIGRDGNGVAAALRNLGRGLGNAPPLARRGCDGKGLGLAEGHLELMIGLHADDGVFQPVEGDRLAVEQRRVNGIAFVGDNGIGVGFPFDDRGIFRLDAAALARRGAHHKDFVAQNNLFIYFEIEHLGRAVHRRAVTHEAAGKTFGGGRSELQAVDGRFDAAPAQGHPKDVHPD